VAYGEAHGLDPAWLTDTQKFLRPADLTVLLDISPEIAVKRKTMDRDQYERDTQLLSRVRDSYVRQAVAMNWVTIDGSRSREDVSADVMAAVSKRLGPR
jgi:thymidylate kinase